MFISEQKIINAEGYDGPGIYAFIQSLEDNWPKRVQGSELIYKSKFELDENNNKIYRIVNIDSLNSTCCAIPNIGGDSDEMLIIKPPSEWSHIFISRSYSW